MAGDLNQGREVLAQSSLLLNLLGPMPMLLTRPAMTRGALNEPVRRHRPPRQPDAATARTARQPGRAGLPDPCGSRSSAWPTACSTPAFAAWPCSSTTVCPGPLIDLACTRAGIVVIPVPHFFSPAQQAWLLESSGADALVGPEHQGWQAAAPLVLMAGRPDEQAVPCGAASQPACPSCRRAPPRSPIPGHHGPAQGVCLSLAQMTAVCESLAERVAPARVEQHLTLLPLTTLLENLTGLYVPLLTGASSRIPPWGTRLLGLQQAGSRHPWLRPCCDGPATAWCWCPSCCACCWPLCGANPVLAEGLRGLRFVAVGGGKVAPDLIGHARAAGLPVYEGYGLSGCGSVVALNGPWGSPGQRRPALPHCR